MRIGKVTKRRTDMPEYKVLTYRQTSGEEQNMEVHMYGFDIKLLDRKKTGSDEVEHLVEAPNDDAFLDWWFDNAALDRWGAKDYYAHSGGKPKRFSLGAGYTQRIIELVTDYCETYLYDGYMVKEDGDGRLIVYTDDYIHSEKVARGLNEEGGGLSAQVTSQGTEIHIKY